MTHKSVFSLLLLLPLLYPTFALADLNVGSGFHVTTFSGDGESGTQMYLPISGSTSRLPTSAEWDAKVANLAGAFASPLKLISAGYRDRVEGSLFVVGSYGGYWSSSVDGISARPLVFSSGHAVTYSGYRAVGRCVRCLED